MPAAKRLQWLPNAITGVRLAAAVPVLVCALQGAWALGFWIMMIALVSDFVDGAVARKLGVSSDFGAKLDGNSDFVLSAAGIAGLVLSGNFPATAALAVLTACLLMVYARSRASQMPKLNAILPMFEVGTLFLAWTYIVWAYAVLAFGWSWLFVPVTLVALVVLGILKRVRLRVWCAAILRNRA